MGRLKKVVRDDFQLDIKRDYAAEERSAQISLFSDMERLIDQKQAGDIAVWQVALCLILCGLPYDETPEQSVTRRARLADGSWLTVRFTATGERVEYNKGEPVIDPVTGKQKVVSIPLPFGADRGPLHFLINKAVLQAKDLERKELDVSEARFVKWEKADESLQEMCLAQGGKNRRDLRARIDRIKYCAITVTRTNHGTEDTLMAPMLSRTRLPRSLDASYKKTASPNTSVLVAEKRQRSKEAALMGVEFSSDFFDEFLRNHMPVPVELLRATMGRAQLQDYVLWLYWRAFAAKKDTLISWRAVREQLWQNDSNEARLYSRMRRAITTLRAVWPELRAEVNPKHFGSQGRVSSGLLIGPPRDGMYMLNGVEAARKQVMILLPKQEANRKSAKQ